MRSTTGDAAPPEATSKRQMPFQLDRAIEILERTPATLSALLSGLSDEWVEANEGPETFSPKDVLGHLITGEETDWIARAKIIIEDGTKRPFEPFDRFAFRERHGHRSLSELLELFAAERARSLDELRELSIGPAELQLEGAHPGLGQVTLAQLLAAWVVHDLGHIRQIVRVMAGQYRDTVGPWTEYLTILER